MFKSVLRKTLFECVALTEWLFPPKPVQRSQEECRKLARETSGLALYDYKGCPGSRMARREIQRLNLEIERRDIRKCAVYQDMLLSEFGALKAPCLRIEEKGRVKWLDEPDEIIHYLHLRFGSSVEIPQH